MKNYITLLFCLASISIFGQKKCDYDINITDSLGAFKATKEYLIYEKVFGSNEHHISFTLSNSNGVPFLSMQSIKKNMEFIPVNCFDTNSKIYFQLQNGKIVSLLFYEPEGCGTMIQAETTKQYVRILTGNFLFPKESFEELKKSPISLMRIKFGAETEDYIIKSELQSEIFKTFYRPESYFMEYLHCVEN